MSGRYRLVARLGSGGAGEVWEAYDERLHRTVALKRLRTPPGPEADRVRELAVREGRIAAKLQHPHAITVFDVAEDGDSDDAPYLVMEYLPSTTLAEVLAEQGPLDPAEVVRIGAAVAEGLAAAHEAGVVHRDVKPGNVLLGVGGKQVKITDFGISRLAIDVSGTLTGTVTNTVRGTPAYLAPEIARGEPVTFASDVYSLGATLYSATEGVPPFGRDDNPIALLYRVSTGEHNPPTRAGVLTPLLERMLASDPKARPTMAEVRDELAAGPTGAPVDAATADLPSVEPERQRPRTAYLVATLALLIAVAGVLFTVALRGSGEQDAGTVTPSAAPSTVVETTVETVAPTTAQSTQPQATTEQPVPTANPPVTTAPPAAPPVNRPADDSPQAKQAAVADYYAMMPGGVEQAWSRLSPRFQGYPAKGMDSYRRFWASVTSVKTSNVVADAGTVVNATVNYVFTDGRAIQEQHRYVVVNLDGQWKIDQVTVVSSRGV
ncbi:serine/threonine protein kinase [Actinokineospora auranticolor]|uniref:non-specific serine/threonine protein kinase n=1 Tax=Actinokineospora auranticolor TaxID=155976 RepID=A0A2S6H0F0_9PSEU|nr:serine/threonine protein kinase [Actinokineospora auranticolor]